MRSLLPQQPKVSANTFGDYGEMKRRFLVILLPEEQPAASVSLRPDPFSCD